MGDSLEFDPWIIGDSSGGGYAYLGDETGRVMVLVSGGEKRYVPRLSGYSEMDG
jgi:hypothetical protein